MITDFCVVCGIREYLENHHIVPRSLGGLDNPENLITLCHTHHREMHGVVSTNKDISSLTKAGIVKAKLQGRKPGNPQHLNLPSAEEGRKRYHKRRKDAADDFAGEVYPLIMQYKQQGLSNAKVAEELNKIGMVAPSGKSGAWNLTNVGKCINRVKGSPCTTQV